MPDLRAIRGGADVTPPEPTTSTTHGDSWSTDAAGYSPGKFYTGSGGREHANLQLAIPMNLMTVIDQLVQGGRVPEYTTRQAVIRDAVVHRLKYVQDEMGRLDAAGIRRLNVFLVDAHLEGQQAEDDARERIVQRLEDLIRRAERTGVTVQLVDVLQEQEQLLRSFPVEQRKDVVRLLARCRLLAQMEDRGHDD